MVSEQTDSDNSAVIREFYEGFQNHDATKMAECYHGEVLFCDPAFGHLEGEQVGKMWAMLIKRSEGNLKISFSDIWVDGEYGGVNWIAEYKFKKRPIRNEVKANFKFQDGKIIEHTDSFDTYKWCRMAFGTVGFILGWSPILWNQVQKKSQQLLSE